MAGYEDLMKFLTQGAQPAQEQLFTPMVQPPMPVEQAPFTPVVMPKSKPLKKEDELLLQSIMSPQQRAKLDQLVSVTKQNVPVADHGAGSGMSNVDKLVLQQRGPVGEEQEYKDMQAKYDALVAEGLNQQQQGINQMSQFAKEMAGRGPQYDWSPLAAYIDSTVEGSKLMQGVPKVQTPEERNKMLFDVQGAIQKEKGALTKEQIDAMKNRLNTSLYNKQLGAMSRQGRFEQSQRLKMEDTMGKDITKLGDELGDEFQKFNMIDEGLNSGDYVKISNTLSNYSRAIAGQKGVLTDKDIALVLPRNFQGSLAKFQEYFRTTEPTLVDPSYVKSLSELADLAKQKTKERYKSELGTRKKRYGSPGSVYRPVYQDFGDMFQDLDSRIEGIHQRKGSTGNIPQSAPTQQTAPVQDPAYQRYLELQKKAQGG